MRRGVSSFSFPRLPVDQDGGAPLLLDVESPRVWRAKSNVDAATRTYFVICAITLVYRTGVVIRKVFDNGDRVVDVPA